MNSKCPLCNRELGTANVDQHHLIPSLKGGKDKYSIHIVCHRKIHSCFTESELATYYNTWERLISHPDIAKFIEWVKKKPIDYIDSSKETIRRKSKRR